MKFYTQYLWFNTERHREYIHISDKIEEIVEKSGIREGMVLISAMHITAGVYVNDAEVGALAALLDMTPAKLRRRYTLVDELGWRQLRFRDGACTFLDPATKRCTVYAARPVQCRTFPYWPELFGPRGWRPEAEALCEGLGHGPAVPSEEVARAMRAMEERDACED